MAGVPGGGLDAGGGRTAQGSHEVLDALRRMHVRLRETWIVLTRDDGVGRQGLKRLDAPDILFPCNLWRLKA